MKFKIRITALIIVVLQILLSAVTVSADDTDSLPPVPPLQKCKAAYLYNFENDTALFEL